MTAFQAPPTRTSRDSVSSGTSTASVPNQTEKCSGFVQASYTSSRGALKVRVTVRGSVIVVLLGRGVAVVVLKRVEIAAEGVETAGPEPGIVADPLRRRRERPRIE